MIQRILILSAFVFSFSSQAVTPAQTPSKAAPLFLEAIEILQTQSQPTYIYKPELQAVYEKLSSLNLRPEFVAKLHLQNLDKSREFYLPVDDRADELLNSYNEQSKETFFEAPALSLHSVGIDVLETSDDVMGDDLYAYYFVTSGVIPTAKVTSIYKDLRRHQGFFFNVEDRPIFPLAGIKAMAPQGHLIVDYGLIESDGDDITEMKKITSVILDIAVMVYGVARPESAALVSRLRKEVQVLADLLMELNRDDRLVKGTIAWSSSELAKKLSTKSFEDIEVEHKANEYQTDDFHYRMKFRLLRE